MKEEIENIIRVRLDGSKWMLANDFLRKDQIIDVKHDIEFCELLMSKLLELNASNQWVKSEERLPEKNRDYITITDRGQIMVRRFDTNINIWLGNPFCNVTHWGELPKPPTA